MADLVKRHGQFSYLTSILPEGYKAVRALKAASLEKFDRPLRKAPPLVEKSTSPNSIASFTVWCCYLSLYYGQFTLDTKKPIKNVITT